MTISKRSWHYRLYRYMGNVPKGPRYILPWTKATRDDVDPPSSLCPYAWSIGLGLVGTVFLIAVATPVAVVLAPFYLLFRALLWTDAKIGLGRLRAARAARKAQREPTPSTPPPVRVKHPSLVAEFVRAKKAKVCPTIKLVD